MWKFLKLLWVLHRYRTRRALFRHIRKQVFPVSDPRYRLVRETYDLMEREFGNTVRESGEPYMTHLHAVTVIIVVYLKSRDINEILAALLHDAVEHFEGSWSYLRLSREYNPVLARYVLHLTKISVVHFVSESDRDQIYHSSFRNAEIVVVRIKLADRFHNILTLRFCPAAKQLRKIAETLEYYLEWAREQNVLYDELRWGIRLSRIIAFWSRA